MNNSVRKIAIVADSAIPFLRGVLEPWAAVRCLPGSAITPEEVRHADALIVRTRTRCDERLLAGSAVRLVATATIGTDHIDLPWCAARGIEVANAPGCNAPAVGQYVFGSVGALLPGSLEGLTLGVVGVGHVGSLVARWGRSLGMRVMECDPPRQRAEGKSPRELLRLVNSFWNSWPYREDQANWGKQDYWAAPAQFLKKSGDCEDYAIVKYFTLKELGIAPDSMRIVILRDTIRNLAHAVLVVYLDDEAYVLDNLSNVVQPHTRLRNYSPQYSVNEHGRWTHIRGRPAGAAGGRGKTP